MIEELGLTDLEMMLENSFNYDHIRIEAVRLFQRLKPEITGISEKCRVYYDYFRVYFIDPKSESVAENLFSIDVYDESVENETKYLYRRCFITAFENLYAQRKLILPSQLLAQNGN